MISLALSHHPTIRPTLAAIVTTAKAPARPYSLLTSNPCALCGNFSVSSFLEICLGVKASPIQQHVTLWPPAPSLHKPKKKQKQKTKQNLDIEAKFYSLKTKQKASKLEVKKRERKWTKHPSREPSRRDPPTTV